MDICVWDKCNNRCQMCTNPDLPWKSKDGKVGEGYDYNVLISRIERLKDKVEPDDAMILTGGEPTLHPHFLDVFNFTRKTFPEQELRILTNGRRFAYRDFAEEVMKADNLNIAVSLCGPTAEIHDKITRTKNSFIQAVQGLENILSLKKENQIVEIRTVLSKLSYRHIDQTLNLIQLKFPSIDRVIVIYLETEGQAKKNLDKVLVPYSKLRPYLNRIEPLLPAFKELCLYHFPLCTLEPKFWPFVWRTLPAKEIVFIKSCERCRYKKYCLGIHRDYPNKTASGEFKPIKEEYAIEETDDFYHPITSFDIIRVEEK
ncbi:MAG: hypothetical protein COU84_01815 [Candidatus Portnoybacteria bacterium CG10_big_fil_rev_8_21_14_0_10_43_39]|uniref:Radical SAM core domain-containing protein n=1 Tax=Candidatus Portnoybacteria bacterium CG10_big_fil_rev_8_21_14_0_10_43_39 TaxID=1974815 RepID=A0A2M8KH95_9BACT|nr:MAG: hypothetical protein COU84_01815 [Candidatus Portnoybacteria bacterium CG10_big_fil_rev_8_21_14_0_10_43_39]